MAGERKEIEPAVDPAPGGEEEEEDWLNALLRRLGHPFTVDGEGRSVPDPDWCPQACLDPNSVLFVDRHNIGQVDVDAFFRRQMYVY
uniref:Uncharacterized protein n=1 Tax=Oryza brachyantha TaxID=4533 RepID=J3LC58_ORYBR